MHSYEFFVKTNKKDIDYINKIIEAHEYVGIVRTINPTEGDIKIITTSDFVKEIREILERIKQKGTRSEIVRECKWGGVL